jgi:GntR family transcriptional repressor for pyruvate dehydrogenase complex
MAKDRARAGNMSENNSQLLKERITSLITQCLRTGEKLPTERQMVKALGVSRTALREALSVFEGNGMIVSQKGSGRYVRMPDISISIINTWSIVIRANPSMLLDFLEIRSILEIHSLPKAVERANVEQIRNMDRQVQLMIEKSKRGESFEQEDREFHRTLFESTRNILLEQLLNSFWELFCSFEIERKHLELESVALQHQKILQAFTRQDVPLLTKLMQEQFADARLRIMNAIIKYQKSMETAKPEIFGLEE